MVLIAQLCLTCSPPGSSVLGIFQARILECVAIPFSNYPTPQSTHKKTKTSHRYTLLYLKWITNKALLYSPGNSAQCYIATWMGGEFGGEWMHVHVWLSPCAVHLKLLISYTQI